MNGSLGRDELNRLRALLPEQANALDRLEALTEVGLPVVAVLGKYNHGKSTLLNALVGRPHFATADVRQTREVAALQSDGVEWLDTPGLDADVDGEDDRQAMDAAHRRADMRLLVHALDMGELDHSELQLARALMREQQETGRPTLVVLTRWLSVEASQRQAVVETIQQQIPEAQIVSVAALCHLDGLDAGNEVLLQSSNIDALRTAIDGLLADMNAARDSEAQSLRCQVAVALRARLAVMRKEQFALRDAWEQQHSAVTGRFRLLQDELHAAFQ